MKPGVARHPPALTSRLLAPALSPTCVSTPFLTAMSPANGFPPVPSTMVASRMTKSSMGPPQDLCQFYLKHIPKFAFSSLVLLIWLFDKSANAAHPKYGRNRDVIRLRHNL